MSSSSSESGSSSESESGPSTATGTTTTTSTTTGTTTVTNSSGTTGTTDNSGTTTTTGTATTSSASASVRPKVVHFIPPPKEESSSSSSSESESDSSASDDEDSSEITETMTSTTATSTIPRKENNGVGQQLDAEESSESESESESDETTTAASATTTTTSAQETTTSGTTTQTTSTTTQATSASTRTTAVTSTSNSKSEDAPAAQTSSHVLPKRPFVSVVAPSITDAPMIPQILSSQPLGLQRPLQATEFQSKKSSPLDQAVAENHRYPTNDSTDSSESVDSEDSSVESDTSSESNSTISEPEGVVSNAMAPTSVIRVVRDKKIVQLQDTQQLQPSNWPRELSLQKLSNRDVVYELCKRVHGSGENRVPRAALFVACRSLGMDDSECASVLFGVDDFISFETFYATVDHEAQRIVSHTVENLFRSRDRFGCGELRRSTVEALLVSLGVCAVNLAHIGISVAFQRGTSNRAIVSQCVPQSEPPQRSDVTIDVTPRNFQMFVDNVRGEVTCNGISICSRVDASQIGEVVQAVQQCVFVASLVDANYLGDDECNVEYEPLIASILATVPSSDAKSMARENILGSFRAGKNVDGSFLTDHIEPFLARSGDKRLTMIPPSLQQKKVPQPESIVMLNVVPRDVFLSHPVPQDATRYLLVTLVTTKNVVFPSVKIFPKPRSSEDEKVWHFSKKKVNNNIIVVGDPADFVYVEVCFDAGQGKSSCAGFVAAPLSEMQSGAFAVKSGTFFRPQEPKSSDSEEQSSCFCFTSTPSTRVVVDVKKMNWDAEGDIVHRQPRILVLERQTKTIRAVREYLMRLSSSSSPSKAIRWQVSQALFALNENNQAAIDSLCELWESSERQLSKELRADPTAVDQRLGDLVSRFFGVASVSDDSRSEWVEFVSANGKQLGEVSRPFVAPIAV